MDSLLDQVNALIKMQVGDPYRLEHIKSRVEENKVLALSDKKYISDLLDSHIRNAESDENQTSKIESTSASPVNFDSNNCWKCGNKNTHLAKFCNNCGSSIEQLADTPKVTSEKPTPDSQSWIQTRSTTMPKRLGKGKKILIGIGILVILIVIVGLMMGDEFLETIENVVNGLQQQIGSLLEGLSVDLKIPFNFQ
jgi:regulator of replication initiation timing